MAAITEKITRNQEKQLNRFMEDMVSKMGLSKGEAQGIIANFGSAKPELEKVLRKYSLTNGYFGEPVTVFDLTVPVDYDHDTQIDRFGERVRKKKTTYCYNQSLTSGNFSKATNKLVPGKTYQVRIIPILRQVASKDCLAFLRKKNAILVGGQGLALAYDLGKDHFPINEWTVSFDEKEALHTDTDGYHNVPYVDRDSDGDYGFDLGLFELYWHQGHCLLFFCDISA